MPAAAGLDDPLGRLTSTSVMSPQSKRSSAIRAKARPGAPPDGVLARQVPVDQVVVAELRVVGDVGEVLEDLLARAGRSSRERDGLHGPAIYSAGSRSRADARAEAVHADRVAVLAVAHELAALRLARGAAAGTARNGAPPA